MRPIARVLLAPAVGSLFLWMIVPLAMTIYFSIIRYNLMEPGEHAFVGIEVEDPRMTKRQVVVGVVALLGEVLEAIHRDMRAQGSGDLDGCVGGA